MLNMLYNSGLTKRAKVMVKMTKRSERLSLRERNKLRTRQEVLDAALDVFNEDGFAGSSIDKIADLAGISKGTVYVYFPDGLNDIYREIYSSLSEQLSTAGAERRAGASDPVGRIMALAEVLMELVEEPKYGRFYSLISPELRPVLSPVLGEVSKEFATLVAQDIKELYSGSLKVIQCVALSELLIGAMREAAKIVSETPKRKKDFLQALREIAASIGTISSAEQHKTP